MLKHSLLIKCNNGHIQHTGVAYVEKSVKIKHDVLGIVIIELAEKWGEGV